MLQVMQESSGELAVNLMLADDTNIAPDKERSFLGFRRGVKFSKQPALVLRNC